MIQMPRTRARGRVKNKLLRTIRQTVALVAVPTIRVPVSARPAKEKVRPEIKLQHLNPIAKATLRKATLPRAVHNPAVRVAATWRSAPEDPVARNMVVAAGAGIGIVFGMIRRRREAGP